MAPPQKGKQGTKGSKQIVEENKSTLVFYRNMTAGSCLAAFISLCIFYSGTSLALFIFGCAITHGAYQFMLYMAKVKYTENGQILDSGVDLNMTDGVAEHVKDIIIWTVVCQVLGVISNYFWYLWLLVPMRGFWMLWKNVLGPWFFQPAPENEEVNEKKQKKLERKMRRQQR